jgi:succinate dehydrogenase/fumarate reductase flavoprotein subunit
MNFHSYNTKVCDVLIIGGGGAGVIAATEASKNEDIKTILVSKGPVGQSGLTPTANGGTYTASSADMAEAFFKEMVTAGRFLNDQNIVWYLTHEIHKCLHELQRYAVHISPIGSKAVCVPCITTLRNLRNAVIKRTNFELMEDILITSLITSDGKTFGATAVDIATGEFFVIEATAIIIATGGLVGELYPFTSNNPFGIPTDASGTGHVAAFLAGAELIDMEMIQFVPLPANPRCLNLRYYPEFWAGPYLNRNGEVTISNGSAYQGGSYSYLFTQELFKEMEKGNGPFYIDHRNTEAPNPYTGIKSWDNRRKLIKLLGVDPQENKIEITIGSHFCMGGIRVNEKTETTIPGLYAAGEVMGGVHGAMRLPGASFAQMIVFGFEAGKHAAYYARDGRKSSQLPTSRIYQEKERIFGFIEPKDDPISVTVLKKRLQRIMQEHVFIFRDKNGLKTALNEIRELKKDIPRIFVPDSRFNLVWIRAIELSSMIEAAEIIAESALAREESRGAHYRRDFPKEDNKNWLKHMRAKQKEKQLKVETCPVVIDRMKPEVHT